MQEQLTANISRVCDPVRCDPNGWDGDLWRGVKTSARTCLETRDYSQAGLCDRLRTCGTSVADLIQGRVGLGEVWIPGVEIFGRQVYQQPGRGHFGELARTQEGVLNRIGLRPRQWASAMMHRDSAKGIHIHPPYVPDELSPEAWFRKVFSGDSGVFSLRPYDREQWDVMFFLTGICEMFLIDERVGLPRRIMRFVIDGDSRPGPNNAGVVIPAGVGHALRSIGSEDLVMVYGTSTSFNPEWEGRIASEVEKAPLPAGWEAYLASVIQTSDGC